MTERIIVSLTTWSKRIGNLPTVLDTILAQTQRPDLIVVNLAYDEIIPDAIQTYFNTNNIEVFRVADTKVYKKIIPTLKRYPSDVVINIDDDWLYPTGMIADFMKVHTEHPNNPISGNGLVYSKMICHCGCASLTKAEYFGQYLDSFDDNLIKNCHSSDIVYTYFATKAGHPYIHTKEQYFTNMQPFNEGESYSVESKQNNSLSKSLSYLIDNFGDPPRFPDSYISDQFISDIIYHIHQADRNDVKKEAQSQIRNTFAYKTGKKIILPLSFIRRIITKH